MRDISGADLRTMCMWKTSALIDCWCCVRLLRAAVDAHCCCCALRVCGIRVMECTPELQVGIEYRPHQRSDMAQLGSYDNG